MAGSSSGAGTIPKPKPKHPIPDGFTGTDYTGQPQPPPAALAAFLGSVGTVYVRADCYQSDGTTLYIKNMNLTTDSTGVTVDNSRPERRMFDVVFSNGDGSIVHAPRKFWYDKVIKLYRGIAWPGGHWDCQVGEFMIDKIDEYPSPGAHMQVTGRDYTKKLLVAKIAADTTFPAGSTIESAVYALAANAGVSTLRMTIPNTTHTFPFDYTIAANTTYAQAISDIVSAYGYETFFDRTGQYVMRPFQDPATAPQTFTFDTGADTGTLITWHKISTDGDMYNVQVVNSTYVSSGLLWAKAVNNNSESPTSVQNLNSTRTNYTTTSLATTYAQCLTIAQNLLAVSALEDFEIDMSTICLPWLEAADVIQINLPDDQPTDPTRFLLTSFDIPFKLGPSSPIGKRIVIVH